MEAPVVRGLAAGWEQVVIGAPARFAVDGDERRGGGQSVRLSASEAARSYLTWGEVEKPTRSIRPSGNRT